MFQLETILPSLSLKSPQRIIIQSISSHIPRPPKVKITKENKRYLQLLDILELMDRAPIDEENPYLLLANYIHQYNLQYEILLALATEYYTRNTILLLGNVAKAGRSHT